MKPLDARQWCVAVDDQSLFLLFMRILLILVAMSVIGLMVWAMRWLAMQRAVRSFFVIPLLLSIVFPFYSFLTTLRDFAHNQYARRFAQMEASPPPDMR